MTNSTAKFKSALRESVSKEFAHVPTDENSIDHTFSKNFEKQMDKLIKSQRKTYYVLLNTAAKRVAVILVVCLVILTATFSIKAFREPTVNLIKKVYSTFTHYSFEGETTDIITKEYTIKAPDGFKQTYKHKSDGLISTQYENSSGVEIHFNQMTTRYSAGFTVDTEHGETFTKTINKMEVHFQKRYDTQTVFWTKDGYFFYITCFGDIDSEAIEDMIKSLN